MLMVVVVVVVGTGERTVEYSVAVVVVGLITTVTAGAVEVVLEVRDCVTVVDVLGITVLVAVRV